MAKISQIRIYNLVSKFNKQEYSLILNAFEESGFSTLGHFHRETLLNALKEQDASFKSCEVPPINARYARQLLQTLQDLHQLVEHLNQSLIEDNNSEGRRIYLSNAIQLVHDTAKHSLKWFDFFTGQYNYVIEDIALETLSSESLTDLAQLKAARERSK
ncbi:hypothetical protein [uncultured Pseudoalteromonas sp.]|uniref:hypothetical protein n=1 Tax=uncultured Pseudoalteromonas sp. TaxID=114053 RepID=UPI0032B173E2